jgi:tol-pal system beta propeller repeat protein TolB
MTSFGRITCHSLTVEVCMRNFIKTLIALVTLLSLLGFAAAVSSDAAALKAVYLPLIMRSPVPLTILRLAFVSQDNTGYREIYVMQGDGSQQMRVTNNQAYNDDPVWSPQGARIAYVSAFLENSDFHDIYVVNIDGSGQTRLTKGGINTSPAWSPKSSQIAFVSTLNGNGQINLVNADDLEQMQLTYTGTSDYCPAWSPDGAKIAFLSTRDGDAHIYLMNADGSGQTRLTSTSATEDCPIWSPDGAKIAFVAHSDSSDELDVVRLETGATIHVYKNPPLKGEMGIYYPEWSPDSTQILFNVHRSVFPYSA